MALTLYFVPFTRAIRPRWLLEELGVPHQLVRLNPAAGDNKTESYLKLNPLGHVPTLVDDETTVIESAAIVMYLADKFPEGGLAPQPGSPARGEYYQWIMLSHATLEPAIQPIHDLQKGRQVDPSAVVAAKKRIQDIARLCDAKLNGRMFCAGDRFSAADIVLTGALFWANVLGQLHDFPRLQAYASQHLSRPAAKRSREA